MPSSPHFSSVKLPSELVQKAKDAAKPMRRSAAGQIEYSATLGRVFEAQGLSVREAQAAIVADENHAALDSLTQKMLSAQSDGSLVENIRAIVKANRAPL